MCSVLHDITVFVELDLSVLRGKSNAETSKEQACSLKAILALSGFPW